MTTSQDPADRYEALARVVFNCGRNDGPFGKEHADNYEQIIENTLLAKRMLSRILCKMVIDYQGTSFWDTLKKLEDKIWEANSQDDYIKIITKAIDIYKNLNK